MKKCILYDDRICNDCGECLLCDLDPEKLCNNCGKCIEGDGGEFISMLVRRNDPDDFESSDEDDELDGMDGGFDFVEGGNEGKFLCCSIFTLVSKVNYNTHYLSLSIVYLLFKTNNFF